MRFCRAGGGWVRCGVREAVGPFRRRCRCTCAWGGALGRGSSGRSLVVRRGLCGRGPVERRVLELSAHGSFHSIFKQTYHAAVVAREPESASLLEYNVARHHKFTARLLRAQSLSSTVGGLVRSSLRLMGSVSPPYLRSSSGGCRDAQTRESRLQHGKSGH